MKQRVNYLRIIVLCLLFCLPSFSLYAKDNGIKIYGTYKVNGDNTGGVQVRLLRNGIKESSSISGNGKFEYSLQFNSQYELQFSKTGYITKKVVISTDVPERVLDANSDFPPFKIEIELFREVEGGDYSIFDEPVAMVIYDKELDDFDFDRAYNAEIEEEIKGVEAKIINAPIAQKTDKDLRLYQELIKKADGEFNSKSYVEARKTYQKAQKVKPSESYPQIRIDLIDKTLVDLAKREKQKAQNDSYYALVDKADVLLEKKKYSQARSYYAEASKIKREQQYPKDKIRLIDQIFAQREAEQRKYDNTVALADRYFKEEKYEPARKEYENALAMRKDESYPQEQISRINRLLEQLKSEEEREQNYKDAIAKADSFFNQKNWFDAQDAYQKATDVLPKKKYPKEQLAAIDKILKAEKKELGQYTEAIEKADNFFASEDWNNAQRYYEKALRVKPNEVYPQEQIKKVEMALADMAKQKATEKSYKEAIEKGDRAFGRKNWEEAKSAYFSALKLKPEENYPQQRIQKIEEKLAELAEKKEAENRYNEKLKQADLHYDQKQWNEALAQYKAVSEMKPAERYPKAQIKKIEQFLKEELKRKTAQEIEDNYNKYIADGDKDFEAESWDAALANYEGALQIKAKATYPKQRILAINKRIDELAELEEMQKKYDVALAEADQYFQNSDWLPAIAMYEKALDIKPEESYPKSQIKQIKATLSAEDLAKAEAEKAAKIAEQKTAYDQAIKDGDTALAAKRYGLAKNAYRKALGILSGEQYPKDKLQEIDDYFKQKNTVKRKKYTKIEKTDTVNRQYYKRIEPEANKGTRYVKMIDATQVDLGKYDSLIEKAEQAESTGNLPFAKAYYRQAYLEKPSVKLFNKLEELDRRTTQKLLKK